MATAVPNIDVKVGMSLDELAKLSRQEKKQNEKQKQKEKRGFGPGGKSKPAGKPVKSEKLSPKLDKNRKRKSMEKGSAKFGPKGNVVRKTSFGATGMRNSVGKGRLGNLHVEKQRNVPLNMGGRAKPNPKASASKRIVPNAVVQREFVGSVFQGKKRKGVVRTFENESSSAHKKQRGASRSVPISAELPRKKKSILDKSVNAPRMMAGAQMQRAPKDFVVTISNVSKKAASKPRIVQPSAVSPKNPVSASSTMQSAGRKSILITKGSRRV